MHEKLSDIIIDLNRPEYVSTPEALISALAWRVHKADPPTEAMGKTYGYVFRVLDPKPSKTVMKIETTPVVKNVDEFAASLRFAGIGQETTSSELLTRAFANSVSGIQALKSTTQAASPITPALALMQDTRGLMGKKNPPDVALIIEKIFAYGSKPSDEQQISASELWLRAAEHRCSDDEFLAGLDDAVRDSLLPKSLNIVNPDPVKIDQYFPHTPFSWFAESWRELTSNEWVEAVPARVWTDWATTLLRTALGMCFLWEAAWYESFARRILRGESFTLSDAIANVGEVLPWQSSRASASVRDVASTLKWRLQRGAAIRRVLNEWIEDPEHLGLEFSLGLALMMKDGNLRNELTHLLGSQEKSGNENTWEAVKYALKTREEAGPFADHYGLLKSRGRFLTVDPGTEWVAVMASLVCGHGGKADVGGLMVTFQDLGLFPEIADVVQLLENAGMARGSADADQGVQIQSAF